MPYLGTPPQSGFISQEANQYFTGLTQNYIDLNQSISSLSSVIVLVNGVVQENSDLTLTSSSRITLGATLVASDKVTCIYVAKISSTQAPATGSVTSDMLSGSIANSKLSTDPLNASNLASGTIPTARLGSGTASSSTVLFGDQTFKTAPSGAWEVIRTGSVSSGDSYAQLTGLFTSTYKIYKIFFYDWNGSQDALPRLRWVTGTNTLQDGSNAYFYAGVGYNTGGGNSAWSGNDNLMQISGETNRHDSDEQFAWEGTLYNPAGTTLKKRLVFSGGGRRTSNYTYSVHGTAEWNSTTAITGFKVFQSAGDFDSLSWRILGLVE
jgi:hypothetical protein